MYNALNLETDKGKRNLKVFRCVSWLHSMFKLLSLITALSLV